jgi:hypothetical protein
MSRSAGGDSVNLIEKIWEAASLGDPEWIIQVAKMGVDINSVDDKDNGATCAHKAARGGHGQALRILEQLRCDLTKRDANDHTPAQIAAYHGKHEVIGVLCELSELLYSNSWRPAVVLRMTHRLIKVVFLQMLTFHWKTTPGARLCTMRRAAVTETPCGRWQNSGWTSTTG